MRLPPRAQLLRQCDELRNPFLREGRGRNYVTTVASKAGGETQVPPKAGLPQICAAPAQRPARH